jgi:hypothetical protein
VAQEEDRSDMGGADHHGEAIVDPEIAGWQTAPSSPAMTNQSRSGTKIAWLNVVLYDNRHLISNRYLP